MSSIEFSYPYNPNGDREDCKIRDEICNLTLTNGEDYQFIIPKYSPFFEKGLKVKSLSKNKDLQINVDFILTHKFKSANDYLNQKIFGSITFLDKELTGEIQLTYLTLGGDFTNKDSLALEQLVANLTGHRTVKWEDILDKPITFPPSPHVHTPGEIMDMNDVIASLDTIAELLRGDTYPDHRHTMDQIDGLFDALATKVDNTKHVVFAPTDPVKINGMGEVLLLKLPKVLTETAMRLEIWISNENTSSELVVIGLLEANKTENDPWAGLQVRADNTLFTDSIAGAYLVNGFPVLYLHSVSGSWDNVTITIPKTTYSKSVANNLSGNYTFTNGTTLVGKIVDIDHYIYQSQFLILQNRLHRVKLNTILGETIYDII